MKKKEGKYGRRERGKRRNGCGTDTKERERRETEMEKKKKECGGISFSLHPFNSTLVKGELYDVL